MCLVPCHEVSHLRPMGFVASFGLEQNITGFSPPAFSSLKEEIGHLSNYIQPTLTSQSCSVPR